MSRVDVTVNAHTYTIACDEGEEQHLRELAAHVEAKMQGLIGAVGQVGEARLILMAALLIADDYFDAAAQLDQRAKQIEEFVIARHETTARLAAAEEGAVLALETAARRVEDVATRLASA